MVVNNKDNQPQKAHLLMKKAVMVTEMLELARHEYKKHYSEGVTDEVINQLKKLIPSGISVSAEAWDVFAQAIQQLCSARSEVYLDSLALVNLANNIQGLWNAGWLKVTD